MNDAILIKQLNASDKKAFGLLYDKYVGMVYGFLVSVLRQEGLAEDLTQWCFMQMWERRETISAERNLPAWLYVIARNAAIKELRRQVTAANYVEYALNSKQEAEHDAGPQSDLKVITEEMERVIGQLPESRRKIFLMRTVDGLSVNEIAEKLGISPKTVETQIARAKQALRECVSPLLYLAIIISFSI